MARFKEGNTFSTGRKKGSKNRYSNDVRAAFHKAYDEMGKNAINPDTGKPYTGHEAFLAWARQNQTEFYRLFAKMIPRTAELGDDMHEDFVATLIFEDEAKMIEGEATNVVDVTVL
ncbi:MAG: hypothetical protein GY777_13580 [Candidatus Brocadiaceae bacterium]|nr:hypothetical protein [Candidatus Brocadiaceae bacterium]